MPPIRGFLLLVAFLLIGDSLRLLLDWPVSGGVAGMLLLTLWLMLTGQIGDELANASQTLISVLVLLIMPGVVGVFFLGERFSGQWLAVAVALVLGTLLSVLTTLLLMQHLTPAVGTEDTSGRTNGRG